MFATLPVELLDLVIGNISSRRDLKNLCEVCKYLYDVTTPHLYQTLLLRAPELSLEYLSARLEAIPQRLLKYTQEFGFTVPIHERVESRCVHNDHDGLHNIHAESLSTDIDWDGEIYEDTNKEIDKDHILDPLLHFTRILGSLRLPDDQLRSFRWEVGTCIPKSLFCGNDSFLGNQRNIQYINLITDSECGVNDDTQYLVDLVQFKQLQHPDWRGLSRFDDFQSVKECIKAHGHQIRSLTLDLLTWDRAEDIWANGFRLLNPGRRGIPINFFSQMVLDINPADQKVIFPSLEKLHLSDVSFYHTSMEMVHAFNIDRLKALKLRNCPGSLDWLQMIIDSGKSMELKVFELAVDVDSLQRDVYMNITQIMSKFIQHLSVVDSLYLMLPSPIDWSTLADNISNSHHINRFVIHHLVNRGGLKLIDGDIPWSFHLEQILQKPRLTCFGCSIGPRELSSHFQKMQPRPSCKLVHIRISGVVLRRLASALQPSWSSAYLNVYHYGDDFTCNPEEIYDFAHWAFSSDGLPNLQVLACGDFSYDERYSKFNVLLCKSDNGYQTLTPSNGSSWDLVQDNMDMLAACPLEDILE